MFIWILAVMLAIAPAIAHNPSFPQSPTDYSRPSAKRLADLSVGEPRRVRMIYFLPNDRPYRQEVVDAMKVVMRNLQTFYAEQMEAHGHGAMTFQFETDDNGEPFVHRVDGKHPDSYYTDTIGGRENEIPSDGRDILFIVLDYSGNWGVSGGRSGKNSGGATYSPSNMLNASVDWNLGSYDFYVSVHELGHAFGLEHDWRDGTYVMSYGPPGWDRLSACAADFLSVHPYFNPDIPIEETPEPTIELDSPTTYPTGSASVPVRLNVSDSDGVHQVILMAQGGVKECRLLNGEQEAVVEFDYDGVISAATDPNRKGTSLSNPVVHQLEVMAIDAGGTLGHTSFELSSAFILADQMATFEGYNSVAFSSDGATLATGGRSVTLWDVATLTELATLEAWGLVAFSPDGDMLVTEGETVTLWDVATRTEIGTLEGQTGVLSSMAMSPDGTLLATAGELVKLWGVSTRTEIATLEGHTDWVISVAFSPDGTILASGEGDGMWVKLWDVKTRTETASLQYEKGPVAFSPDGRTLATRYSYNEITLWDVPTLEAITLLEGHRSTVSSVSFSPDGALLASGSSDATVKLWDVKTWRNIATFSGGGEIESVAFSPDGTILAAGTYAEPNNVILWDVSEWMVRFPFTLEIISGDNQQGVAGASLAEPLIVEVLDQYGDPLLDAAVTFTVTTEGGGIILSTETATTDGNGHAVITLTLGQDPGKHIVTAKIGELNPVIFSVTGLAIPTALAGISGDEQQGAAGSVLAEPFVVEVRDHNGQPLEGSQVTFAVLAGEGILSVTTDTTDANGRASTTLTLASIPGTNTVRATAAGLDPVTFTATGLAVPRELTKVSGEEQQGTAGAELIKPFVVEVRDQNNNPLEGAEVTFSVTAGEGTLSAATATTDANGLATTTLTLGRDPATVTVVATVAELDPVTFTAYVMATPTSMATVRPASPISFSLQTPSGAATPASTSTATALSTSATSSCWPTTSPILHEPSCSPWPER